MNKVSHPQPARRRAVSRGAAALAAASALFGLSRFASATSLYWDSNGTTPGAGTTPTGTWGTSNFWNSDSTGGGAGSFTAATGSGDDAFFSAGTDATGTYTVTVNGSQSIHNITLEEGAATLSGGTLTLGGSTPTITTTANGVINSVVDGSAGLTKAGTGTLTLGSNNTYTGATSVNGGTLTLSYSVGQNGSRLHDSSALIFNGGTVNLNTLASGAHTEVVASTTVNAGLSSITRSAGTGVLQLDDVTSNRALGGVLSFGAANIATTSSTNTNGILGGWANIGNDWAMNSTNGTNGPITAYTAYDISTSDWVGGAIPTANVSMPNATSAAVTTATINSLKFNSTPANGTSTVTISGALTISSGGILGNAVAGNFSVSNVITGGTLTAGVGKDLVVNEGNTFNSSNIQIVSTIVDNGGAIGLTKTGAGTVTLSSGANTYSGTTYIQQGMLLLGSTGGLGTGAVVDNGILGANNGTGGVTRTISNAISGTGSFVAGIGAASNSITLGGNGTFILTGNNTFSGGIVVAGQTNLIPPTVVQIGNGGSTGTAGTGTITLNTVSNPGGQRFLNLNRNNTYQVDNLITGSPTIGAVQQIGTGTVILTNASNNYTAATTVMGGGTLSVSKVANGGVNSQIGASTNASSNLTIGNGGTLQYNGSGDSTDRLFVLGGSFNGQTGSGTIDSSGTGAINFTNSGSLFMAGTGVNTSTLTLTGSNAGQNTLSPIIGNRGSVPVSVSKTGAGTWVLAGANKYNGSTTVSNGTLALGSNNALGYGGAVGFSGAAAGGVGGGGVGTTTVSAGASIDLNGATVNEPITLNGGSLVNNNLSTAAKVNDGIAGITLGSAGTLYSSPGAAPVVNISGGGGSGASAATGFGLTSAAITLNTGGQGYSPNSSFVNLIGSGGTGAQIFVVSQSGNGIISTFNFQNAGFGYTSPSSPVVLSTFGGSIYNNAAFNVDMTKLQVSGIAMTNGGSGYTSAPTVSITGGTTTGTAATAGTAILSSITLSSTSNVGGDGDLWIPLAISGAGGLVKVGTGTLTLTGANVYGGTTNVSAGTLLANNTTGSATSSAAVTIASNGTLGGTGRISGAVTVQNNGTLAPGNSPGSLELTSTLNLQSGSSLSIELGGTNFVLNSTEEYDRVKVTGLTTLAGTLDVSLINAFALADNQVFGIVDALGGRSGTFSTYAEGATVLASGSLALRITYLGNVTDSTVSTTGGTDVVLYTVYAPEPAGAVGVLLMAGAAMGRRRRKMVRG